MGSTASNLHERAFGNHPVYSGFVEQSLHRGHAGSEIAPTDPVGRNPRNGLLGGPAACLERKMGVMQTAFDGDSSSCQQSSCHGR